MNTLLQSDYSPVDLSKRVATNNILLSDLVALEIRKRFDGAITTLEANSWIQVARNHQLDWLVTEMVGDMEDEDIPDENVEYDDPDTTDRDIPEMW